MKKVYLVSKSLSAVDASTIKVTTSKKKAELMAAILSTNWCTAEIFVKDVNEYDSILEAYKFIPVWKVIVKPFMSICTLESAYTSQIGKEVSVSYNSEGVVVEHIAAKNEAEAIEIAKEKSKQYIKEMFRDWCASGYLDIPEGEKKK